MTHPTAIYLVHRRSEHEFREWIIMPQSGQVPINVWTRYVQREGARPVWRGTRNTPTADDDRRKVRSVTAVESVASTIKGHERQNARALGGRVWTWDEPVAVEVTPDEVVQFTLKTPYPVLRRVERVLRARASAQAVATPATS